jgi:hypothetical protein
MNKLPMRDPAQVIEAFPELRQSLLAHFDQCPLATRFDLEGHPYTGGDAARGIVFHHFAERYLQAIKEMRERRMPTAEALEVLYECESQVDVDDAEHVHVPAEERETLRIAALKFCEHELSHELIRYIEERFYATVRYIDANGDMVDRVITGKPDVIIADPPDGVVIPDWKTTRSPPPRPAKQDPALRVVDDPLSPEGYFQQRTYALLAFRNFPKVDRVTLREFYPLAGESRNATLFRYQLEHVEREVALTVQELDRALAGGHDSELWKAQAGRHCRYCPRPMDCPIDRDGRQIPIPIEPDERQEWAERFIVNDRRREYLRLALREDVSQNGPIDVDAEKGEYQLKWRTYPSGERRFGLWPKDS